MPTYRKRGDSWRAEISVRGIREGSTLPSKREAVEWATKRTTELSAVRTGKVQRETLDFVLDRYSKEISPTKAGVRWEQIRILTFRADKLLANMVMQDVSAIDLAAWRDRRLATGIKSSSALREINILKAVWRQAQLGEWHYTDHNPWKEVTMPKRGKPRITTFKGDQAARVVCALGYLGGAPKRTRQQAAVALLLALETAMRAGEMLAMRWEDYHEANQYVHLPETKNGDARDVPLSRRAIELFSCMRGLDDERVFTISSQSLDVFYRGARDLAGITNDKKNPWPTFHDSRATALTRLSKLMGILELAKMTGHRDPRSLMIYYREDPSVTADKLG